MFEMLNDYLDWWIGTSGKKNCISSVLPTVPRFEIPRILILYSIGICLDFTGFTNVLCKVFTGAQ